MSFVYDNSTLNGSKVNRAPLPGGEDPNKWIQANEDWNPTISAVYDLRQGIINNAFLGVARQVIAPTVPVSGAVDYLWANNSGDLFWHKNGSGDQQLNGSTGGSSNVFFWDTGTTWDTLWAQVQLAGGHGLILLPPGASQTITTFASPYDFSNIRFVGIGPFRAVLSLNSGVHIDGGTIAMLDVENIFVFTAAPLMTSTSKDVWIRIRHGSLDSGSATPLFSSSSGDLYMQLETSSISRSAAGAIFHMTIAGARTVVETFNGTFPQSIPVMQSTNLFTGVAGTHFAAIADPLTAAFLHAGVGAGVTIESLADQYGQLSFPQLATVSLPTPSTLNKGQVVYDTTAGKAKYSDGSAWQVFASAAGENLQAAYDAGRQILFPDLVSPIDLRVDDGGGWFDFRDDAGLLIAFALNYGDLGDGSKTFGMFDATNSYGIWFGGWGYTLFGKNGYLNDGGTTIELGSNTNPGNQLRINSTYSWLKGPNAFSGVKVNPTSIEFSAGPSAPSILRYVMDATGFTPQADNTYTLGAAGARWSAVYTSTVGNGANQHQIPTSVASTLAILGLQQTFTKNQRIAKVALGSISASTVSTDANNSSNFTASLSGACVLANPTNLVAGDVIIWAFTNDGTATLTYGNLFTWPGGTTPTLTAVASAVDTIMGYYDGTKIRAVAQLAYS